MKNYISNINFYELEPMKYYAPPTSWTQEKTRDTVKSRIFSGEWLAAEKKDGFFGKLLKDEDGNIGMYSRSKGVNGEYPNKIEWLPQLNKFFEAIPNGSCLLGELYLPKQPGSKCVQTILGCLKEKGIARQEKGEKICFYVFDILAWDNKVLMNEGYGTRTDFIGVLKGQFDGFPYLKWATYYSGTELWEQLQKILARGGEGMVIIHTNAPYEPGKRPSKTTLKVKKELNQTIDCFFTGRTMPPTHLYTGKEIEAWQYWEDMITGEKIQGWEYKNFVEGKPIQPITKGWFYGWAGSLEIGVIKNGNENDVQPIGWLSNLTEEIKSNVDKYARKPIEVTAMELDTSDGISLRHGRLVGFRDDLTLLDCSIEKIIG